MFTYAVHTRSPAETDQDWGKWAGSYEKVRLSLRAQARSRGGRWCWTLKTHSTASPFRHPPPKYLVTPIIDQEQGGGAGLRKLDFFCFTVVPQQLCYRHRPCDSAPHSSWNSKCVVVLAVVFPSAPVVTVDSCVEILALICMKRRPEDTTIFRGTFNNYIVQVCLQIELRIYQYENSYCRIGTNYGHFGLRSAD